MVHSEVPRRPERKHIEPNPSGSYEELEIGKRTFMDVHNRKSVNEYKQEEMMGYKKRVGTLYDQRNGMQVSSLGDKVYKAVEY